MIKRENLMGKLEKDQLSTAEVMEGIRECFVITNRAFFAKRQPDRPTEEVDSNSEKLVLDVFERQSLTPESATPVMLRHAIEKIDAYFEFAHDPELATVHNQAIDKLLSKLNHTHDGRSSDSQSE